MFQFGGIGALFGGLIPQKPPCGDGTVILTVATGPPCGDGTVVLTVSYSLLKNLNAVNSSPTINHKIDNSKAVLSGQ